MKRLCPLCGGAGFGRNLSMRLHARANVSRKGFVPAEGHRRQMYTSQVDRSEIANGYRNVVIPIGERSDRKGWVHSWYGYCTAANCAKAGNV